MALALPRPFKAVIMCRRDMTEFRAQRWQLIAPRVRRLRPLNGTLPDGPKGDLKPHEYLFDHRLVIDAWSALARPWFRQDLAADDVQTWSSNAAVSLCKSASHIERLPAEILHTITTDLVLDPEDVVAMGLSHHASSGRTQLQAPPRERER